MAKQANEAPFWGQAGPYFGAYLLPNMQSEAAKVREDALT